jgi:hypothetical protein
MEGKSLVNSGLQPGRQPHIIPIEVSTLIITNSTVPCPAIASVSSVKQARRIRKD